MIVVEGYLDVIAAVMAGFEGTVAPMGTALTEDHLQLLWRMSDAPILCFDGDSAGQRAAERAAGLVLPLLQPGKTVKIATLPEGLDPDDLIKAQGRDAFADVLDRARSLSDVVWSIETGGIVPETPEARAALEARLRERANSIGDQSVRRHYMQAFDEKLRGVLPAGAPAALRGPARRWTAAARRGSTASLRPAARHAAAGGVGHAAQFAAAEAGPGGRRDAARGGDPDEPRQPPGAGREPARERSRRSNSARPAARKLFAALLDLDHGAITTFRAPISGGAGRAGFRRRRSRGWRRC